LGMAATYIAVHDPAKYRSVYHKRWYSVETFTIWYCYMSNKALSYSTPYHMTSQYSVHITSYGVYVASYGVHISSHGVHAALCGVHITPYGAHATSYGVHVTSNEVQMVSYGVHAASCGVHMEVYGVHVVYHVASHGVRMGAV
jgi:hypothetical protein